MIKSSIQGKITTIKKKGQLYILSVKSGRDFIKCLTSVDVVKNGLDKGNTLYLEGYYSIKNALFPITNLYKVVNGKKIAINIEEHHFYEQIEAMPPMTKKKRGKDGNFTIPETLTRETTIDAEDIKIKVPTINPENLVSKTKPVSSNKSSEGKKKPVKQTSIPSTVAKTETKVEEKDSTIQNTEVKEEIVPENEQIETSETKPAMENLFGINIPNLTAELEDDSPAEKIEETVSVEENNIPAETVETPISVTEETPVEKIEETVSAEEKVIPTEVVKTPVSKETTLPEENKKVNKSTTPIQIEFDDDLDLPIPTFKSSKVDSTVSPVKEEKAKVPVKNESVKPTFNSDKKPSMPANTTKKVATQNSVVQNKVNKDNTEKVVKQPEGKYPVKFSSADLM